MAPRTFSIKWTLAGVLNNPNATVTVTLSPSERRCALALRQKAWKSLKTAGYHNFRSFLFSWPRTKWHILVLHALPSWFWWLCRLMIVALHCTEQSFEGFWSCLNPLQRQGDYEITPLRLLPVSRKTILSLLGYSESSCGFTEMVDESILKRVLITLLWHIAIVDGNP